MLNSVFNINTNNNYQLENTLIATQNMKLNNK